MCARSTIRYETALVFEVSSAVQEAVGWLREHSPLSAHAARQTPAHLTILFVGFPDGDTLELLERELRNPPSASFEVPLSGLGCFGAEDRMTNLHFVVEPVPALIAVHKWACARCESVGWQPPSEYTGSRYVPHITIFGDLDEPLSTMNAFAAATIPARAQLRGMTLRAHPVLISR